MLPLYYLIHTYSVEHISLVLSLSKEDANEDVTACKDEIGILEYFQIFEALTSVSCISLMLLK